MESISLKTVGEVVAENYKTADVFKKYGIDFCCGGGVSISEICKKKNLDFSEVEKDLLKIDSDVPRSHDFNNWKLDFLIDYILNTHHQYVLENIPLIIQYSDKVAKVHGQNHPETIEINKLFHAVAEELIDHMKKEENILFPFIKVQVQEHKTDSIKPNPPFGTVQNPIRMMESEHEMAGDIFKNIDKLTNNYQPPEGACNTFKVLYAKLQEFEEDLHQHIHLENNILFPRAILLEQN